MTDKVTEILCKQLQLLAEESENMRNDVQSLCELTKVTQWSRCGENEVSNYVAV